MNLTWSFGRSALRFRMTIARAAPGALVCALSATVLSAVAFSSQDSEAGAPDETSLDERERRLDEQEARLQAMETELRGLLDEASGPESDRNGNADRSLPRASATDVMEHQPDAGLGRGEGYTDSRFLKSVPLFGSDWRFSFGGYAKVDVLHDFDGVGDPNQFVLAQIPVDGNPQPGSYTTLQAKETRFNFEVRDMGADLGKSRFFVEFDFFDQQNTSSTRLRHAYFEYGDWLVGRNWTTLTELRQLPLLLDFAAGDSLYGNRTEQIRYQADFSEDYNWAVAIENFADDAILNSGMVEGTARSDFPRLVGRIGYESESAVVTFGLSLSQNRWDGTGAVDDESELAWSAMTGGRVYTDVERGDFIGFGASIGDGEPGNILTFANGGVPNAVLDGAGNLENIESWHANVAFHKEWSSRWSSNFSLAYAELDPVANLPLDTIEIGTSAHANLVLQVAPQVRTGLEYMRGTRENVSGSDGSADRVQFSIFYYF